jgi:REP element-mobilizing transposase RayT
MNSRLWFINNSKLVGRILAYLAKYQETYGVVIYAFVIMGNHYHLLAKFPRRNKALFFRDFNGIIAKLVSRHVREFEGGKLWARRVRSQVVPNPEDIKDRFFYAALNPVNAGIARKLSEYEAYNSIQLFTTVKRLSASWTGSATTQDGASIQNLRLRILPKSIRFATRGFRVAKT